MLHSTFLHQSISLFVHKFEAPRDYLTAFNILFTISLAFWNARNTHKKFETQNYPVLKAELELPPDTDQCKLFPIYPNYKVTNISDKTSVDIKIEVKIYSLKRKYKIWQPCLLDRTVTKFDNLQPKAEIKFPEYFQEFRIVNGRLSDKREIKKYTEQKYIENIPIKALINVYYSPVLYHAKSLRVSSTYNLILQRTHGVDFTKFDLLLLTPSLLKLNNKTFMSLVNQFLIYKNLLPRLELSEMIKYRTHYWKLQKIENSWQFPFKLF
ncbi:hypothetical protein Cylst_3724 [Cylindrospermum stagnale PCC 7417]|uniref:Uncharacterized protein n=1 Tax=Cylindrospermum stagnale PCC 7417 TaxID=56107 RepID=K9X277_9NOST|nr:hypothetical protein [Cylindrospermum stagnale]AFZ25847.1 hypothetical protein Cylst_3724 [Cylindrospermum stagnale PCC 7417]